MATKDRIRAAARRPLSVHVLALAVAAAMSGTIASAVGASTAAPQTPAPALV